MGHRSFKTILDVTSPPTNRRDTDSILVDPACGAGVDYIENELKLLRRGSASTSCVAQPVREHGET
jgi:hypothetical protein